jgi:hypothetical protein
MKDGIPRDEREAGVEGIQGLACLAGPQQRLAELQSRQGLVLHGRRRIAMGTVARRTVLGGCVVEGWGAARHGRA